MYPSDKESWQFLGFCRSDFFSLQGRESDDAQGELGPLHALWNFGGLGSWRWESLRKVFGRDKDGNFHAFCTINGIVRLSGGDTLRYTTALWLCFNCKVM